MYILPEFIAYFPSCSILVVQLSVILVLHRSKLSNIAFCYYEALLDDSGVRQECPEVRDELATVCQLLDVSGHVVRWRNREKQLHPKLCKKPPLVHCA